MNQAQQNLPTHQPRQLSLRLNIMSTFTALFLVLVVLIVGFNYYSGFRNSIETARQLFEAKSRLVIQKTTDYLNPAKQAAQLMAKNILTDRLPIGGEFPEVLDYTTNVLETYPQFHGIYYASELGLWGTGRHSDNLLSRQQRFKNSLLDKKTQNHNVYIDTEGKTVDEKRFLSDWDTQTRPWYMACKDKPGSMWSEPYVFIGEIEEIGITATYTMFKNNERVGVSIVDISLKSLANFLKSQIIGKRGYSFIIDENGKLVCFPEMSEVSEKDRSGKPVLKNIVDLKQYPYLIKAYAEFAQGNGTSILVSGKNLEHIVKFIDFPSEFGKQWKLVLTAPEEDFIQNVKQNNIISVAASAIVLLLSLILIYIVSRNIANPIVMLTHETDRIKELDLNSHLTIDSSIKEIRHISDSIARMRSGLQAFKKYVPAALVKQLIETGEEARLGGKNEFLTVFFSDIKDFTEISEGLPPEYLGLHLSEYLDEMTKIIVDNKGTVDKYIGDSIMAFWGAPAKDLKQEIHACRAAVLCQRKIKSLNEKWIHERKPKLETRIGIHTGPTVVGNIGSSDRMNYTVLGDSVNLTSRLEGVNKIYGSNIIISEITYTQLGEEFVARPLDYVVVKGKKEPIKIYHLMDLNDEGVSPDSLQLADLSLKAFEFYLDKKFKDSLQILDEILALYPKDKASMILKARCKNLLDCPPDDTWTGARTGLRMIDLLGPQIDIDES